ncbi:unnamed protein product, partial [Prorocentrum cordatum]
RPGVRLRARVRGPRAEGHRRRPGGARPSRSLAGRRLGRRRTGPGRGGGAAERLPAWAGVLRGACRRRPGGGRVQPVRRGAAGRAPGPGDAANLRAAREVRRGARAAPLPRARPRR